MKMPTEGAFAQQHTTSAWVSGLSQPLIVAFWATVSEVRIPVILEIFDVEHGARALITPKSSSRSTFFCRADLPLCITARVGAYCEPRIPAMLCR
jgi:hypothetical protein